MQRAVGILRFILLFVASFAITAVAIDRLLGSEAPDSTSSRSHDVATAPPTAPDPSFEGFPSASDPAASARPGAGNNAEPGPLPLVLLGTVVAEPREYSMATLRHSHTGRSWVALLGDTLLTNPPVTLVAIEPRRVRVRTPEGVVTLRVEGRSEQDEVASRMTREREVLADPSTRSVAAPWLPVPTLPELEAEPGTKTPSPLERERVMESVAIELGSGLEPSFGENGEILGVRAVRIRDDSPFSRVGFEEGDVIRKVNGIEVDTQDGAARLLRDLSHCQPVTAWVEGANGARDVEVPAEILLEVGCVP